MEYKKKSCFVLLSTLLLTFLLGLFGNVYADTYKTWTLADLKNALYNLTISKYNNATDIKNNIDSSTDLQTILNALNTYDYIFIGMDSGRYNYQIEIMCTSDENIKPYFTSGRLNKWGTNSSTLYFRINLVAYFFQQQNNSITNERIDTTKMYNSHAIYTSSSGTTTQYNVGYTYEDLFNEVYNNNRFIFSYPNQSSFVTIQNDIEPTNYCWISSGYQIFLGTLIDSRYTAEIKYNWWKWNGSRYVYGHYITAYDYTKNGDIRNIYKNTIINNNEYETKFYIDTYNHANDVLHIAITPQAGYNFGSYELYYYIYNNNTVVVDGSVIPTDTFSGNYEQVYNQQQQTNEIIDNIQQNVDNVSDTITDDSEVQNTLDNFTNSSGDLLNSFGYSPLENPFIIVIREVLYSFKDVLLGSGNQNLDLEFGGEHHYVRSQDFVLPNGWLKTLISLICNGFFVWCLYKYGFKLYQWINMGQMDRLVKHTLDDWDKTFWL